MNVLRIAMSMVILGLSIVLLGGDDAKAGKREIPSTPDGTVRAVAVSPKRPQFAVIDNSGELNLFRTDYRIALWQQLTECLPEAKRRELLGETPEQAKVRYAQCQAMVELCKESSDACEQALAKARF